jgi:hypothetical protein
MNVSFPHAFTKPGKLLPGQHSSPTISQHTLAPTDKYDLYQAEIISRRYGLTVNSGAPVLIDGRFEMAALKIKVS